MKVKVFYTHARVSAHVQKVLSLSFSRNLASNYAGLNTLILKYFENYSVGCRVPQKGVQFQAPWKVKFYNIMSDFFEKEPGKQLIDVV